MAYQAAQRHLHKIKNLEWREFRLKMLRYLAQRGFTYDVSADTARRIWEEKDNAEQFAGEGVDL